MNYVEKQKQSVEVKVPAEIYSRISGYFRPLNNCNRAKQEEFKERRFYYPEKQKIKLAS